MAIRWEYRVDSPARGLRKNPEPKRHRYLSEKELKKLLETLDAHPNKTAANAVQLLLLTGARRGEVLNATWDQFDLKGGVWTKPSAHTKQKKEHRIPLSAAAQNLLTGRDSPELARIEA